MASLFERLNAGRPAPPSEKASTLSRRREDPKIFLEDILSNGPAPATLIIERGKARGLTKRQITYARERMKLVALKGPGKDAGWYWVFPHDNRRIPAQQATPGAPLSLNQKLVSGILLAREPTPKNKDNKENKNQQIPKSAALKPT